MVQTVLNKHKETLLAFVILALIFHLFFFFFSFPGSNPEAL